MRQTRISQIKLPSPDDHDPHPRLLLNGYGIHAGSSYTALLPDGWHDITGPACWYISTPGFAGISPVGLFVRR